MCIYIFNYICTSRNGQCTTANSYSLWPTCGFLILCWDTRIEPSNWTITWFQSTHAQAYHLRMKELDDEPAEPW